jgi:hypothetical protein
MFGGVKTTMSGQQSSLFGNTAQQPQLLKPLQPLQSQQQQQQIQQIPSVFNTGNINIQTVEQPSRFEKYELKNTSEHYLFESDSRLNLNKSKNFNTSNDLNSSSIKKRTIPNRLIKRVNKVNSNNDEEDKPSAPILPFKASTQIQPDTFNKDFAYLYEHDKLPTKSLFDPSIFHDDSTSNEILMTNSSFNKMAENPVSFNNAFQRPDRNLINNNNKNNTSNNLGKGENLELPWFDYTLHESTKNNNFVSSISISNDLKKKNKLPEKLYCSVIIYGFNDEHFGTLIEHFAKYGKIMEDLVISDSNYYYGTLGNVLAYDKLYDIDELDSNSSNVKKNKNLNSMKDNTTNHNNHPNNNKNKSYINANDKITFPIFLGPGWVKLTYDNPNSAIRALSDNLTDDGNGNILGVIPYRREDLEILLDQNISDDLNVGEGLQGLSHELELEKQLADNEIGRYLTHIRENDTNLPSASNDGNSDKRFRSSTLTIKNGSNLLLKKQKQKDNKNIWNKGISFFFGNSEI